MADNGFPTTAQHLALAAQAAREAGDYLRRRFGAASIIEIEPRDVKLAEDAEAEAIILSRLVESALPAIAEESGGEDAMQAEACWIVDPLDGSFNFARGFDQCVISIGLLKRGEPFGGVIYDFRRDLLCEGAIGFGVRLNGRPVEVSAVTQPEDAMIATGLPMRRDFSPGALESLVGRLSRYKKVRMIGSAASSLMQVACGVFDAYQEDDIELWDVAAGAALVQAAGGAVKMAPSARAPHAVNLIAAAHEDLF